MHTITKDLCPATNREARHNFEVINIDDQTQNYIFECTLCGFKYSVPADSLLPAEKLLIKKYLQKPKEV
jgi:elongation factor P hydroxylase